MEVRLERLSAEMEFVTVLAWKRVLGEAVQAGDVLLEVEADKVTAEIECPVSGRIAELVAEVGDELKVGAVLAVIDE